MGKPDRFVVRPSGVQVAERDSDVSGSRSRVSRQVQSGSVPDISALDQIEDFLADVRRVVGNALQ
jgi:hypothetical protein